MDAPETDVRMSLTAHLDELRTRLIRALIGIGFGFAICYALAEPLVAFLIRPLSTLRPDQALVIGTGVTEAFFTKLKVCLIGGLFLASPVVFYQLWQFVAPGLYHTEKRVALPFAIAASFFFIAGAGFCYYFVFPVAYEFFLQEFAALEITPQIRISEYLSFSTRMLLGFGVTFELPVVTYFLARLGLVTHRTLIEYLRYAVVAIFIVAAVLTPGPDIASQMLMAAPLSILYILSIGVAWVFGRPAPIDDAAETAPAPASDAN